MSVAKRALVTGASAGLGLCVARELAGRGYAVTLVARELKRLEAALRQLPGTGHHRMALDLARAACGARLVETIEAGDYDLLINNAGASRFGRLIDLDAEMLARTIRLNFETPVRLSSAFVKAAKPGSVLVNVTSAAGTVPIPGNALYCGAKAGLQVLTECLWYEAADAGVRVLDFRPAGMKTGFHQAAGGESMSAGALIASPEAAARDLVSAVIAGRGFVYSYSPAAALAEFARRILPRKLLLRLTGKKSRRMGYL